MYAALLYLCGIVAGWYLHTMHMKRKSIGVIKMNEDDSDGPYLIVNMYDPIDIALTGKRYVTMEVDLSQR